MSVLKSTDDIFVEERNFADEFGHAYYAILSNFDLNSHQLRPDHQDFLRQIAAPFCLGAMHWPEIYAYTDRSGSQRVNYEVSRRRLQQVQQYLVQCGAPHEKVYSLRNKYFGEDFWANYYDEGQGLEDGWKIPSFRRVVVALWTDPFGANPTISPFIFETKPSIRYGRTHAQP